MLAHNRVPVEAETIVPVYGEVVPEGNVAAEERYALDDYSEVRVDHLEGNISGMADAADGWRRIESGTHLVMDYPRTQAV